MPRILVLRATSRSTSTAFEWMMRQRGDLTCFHEPFGEAWYRAEDARGLRLRPISEPGEKLTFDSVRQSLQRAAEQALRFSRKIFPTKPST